MSDGLVKRLRTVDISWSEVGEWCAEAADRIQTLEAELAYYKGFHTGIHSTGTHVVVERTLLDECERAMEDILDYSSRPVITAIAKATLARLRAQEKPK